MIMDLIKEQSNKLKWNDNDTNMGIRNFKMYILVQLIFINILLKDWNQGWLQEMNLLSNFFTFSFYRNLPTFIPSVYLGKLVIKKTKTISLFMPLIGTMAIWSLLWLLFFLVPVHLWTVHDNIHLFQLETFLSRLDVEIKISALDCELTNNLSSKVVRGGLGTRRTTIRPCRGEECVTCLVRSVMVRVN